LAKLRQKNLIKKLLLTSWETIPFNNESVYKKKQIKYFTLKNTDHFISHTDKAKNALIKEGIDNNKISVIRLGIDLTRFKPKIDKPTRSRNFVNKNNCIILFVGRLHPEKSVDTLIKSMQWILKKDKNVILGIVGKGYLRDSLEVLSKDLNLEKNVKFFGCISDEDLIQAYNSCDIFALPSLAELEGMVVLEAMACGKAIIAPNFPELHDTLKDNINCLLYPPGDKQKLVDNITKLNAFPNKDFCIILISSLVIIKTQEVTYVIHPQE